MLPLIFPWDLPGELLTALAYVLAVVAAWLVGRAVQVRGDDSVMGRRGWPAIAFLAALAAGIVVIRVKLGDIPDGPIRELTYGVMMATAFVAGIHLCGREIERLAALPGQVIAPPDPAELAAEREEATREGRSFDELAWQGRRARHHLNDLAFWILVSSLVGARVLFIIVNWGGPDGYGAHPEKIFKVWTGGLVFYGGFMGAVLGGWLYTRKYRLHFRAMGDVMIPALALGHFFGRIGCLTAGCCWGKPTVDPDFLLGAHFPKGSLAFNDMVRNPAVRDYLLAHGTTPSLHPTQLYEAVGELGLFLLLLFLRRGKRFHGQVMATWLVLYAILRLSIETFRGDWGRGMLLRWPAADPILLSTSQTVGLAILGVGIVLYLRWRPREQIAITGAAAPAA
ncbi:MAG: prolipoprotein diacylglyceryl transferase [Deltaproteobacteria bacterium]|nr:prolipoprotein diacylglyceryl transferase [Deltaproteobacteria bacterium]